jgi:L-alanine-DL-glutamate epimerase-like enolase superfamily enzyme
MSDCIIDRLEVSAYRIPTENPESDGTFEWDSTTLVLVDAKAGDAHGIGYTYADTATAHLIKDTLAPAVVGCSVMDVSDAWQTMVRRIRNLGRPGIASMAIAAVDTALWDLKARVLVRPLVELLGQVRTSVPVYYSGGFTSSSAKEIAEEFEASVAEGITAVKMKIGRDEQMDGERVAAARRAIGSDVALFVDANGAYDAGQAVRIANTLERFDVRWFEEPVSSDDLEGMRFVRQHSPPGMELAAGEYGYDLLYFRRMVESGGVDVLQVDVTRCAGITEFLRVGALADAFRIPLSTHTAPSIHLHPCLASSAIRNVECFRDHVHIERMLFDGAASVREGCLSADLSRLGNGLEFRRKAAERYAIGF